VITEDDTADSRQKKRPLSDWAYNVGKKSPKGGFSVVHGSFVENVRQSSF